MSRICWCHHATTIQVAKAQQVSADLKIDYAAQQEVYDEKYKRTIAARDRDIAGLLQRPERSAVDPGSAAACAGGNGAGLARGDATFLERYAADAAVQRDERNLCIAEYGKVKAELDSMREEATKKP